MDKVDEIKHRIKLLSDAPKDLLRKLLKVGKKTISLQELEQLGVTSLRAALFALYELEVRRFGVVSGDGIDSSFTFNTNVLRTILAHNLI